MSKSEQEFLSELRKVFAIEAEEHLQTIVAGLINIENKNDPVDYNHTIEVIYRAAHSLKGASRSVNMTDIGAVCQSLEYVFSAMKNGILTLGLGDFDTLHRTLDSISTMLASPLGEGDSAIDEILEPLERIVKSRKEFPKRQASLQKEPSSADPVLVEPSGGPMNALEGSDEPNPAFVSKEPLAMSETIRVEATKLDTILLQAEELISIKLAGEQRISELIDILSLFGPWKKEWEKVGARARVAEQVQNKQKNERSGTDTEVSTLLESFDWSYSRLIEIEGKLESLRKVLYSDLRTNGMLVDRLLEGTKNVLLLPCSTLLQALPKMVRDISHQQNKEVELVIHGGEIEVDKRILEQIKDPLIHLVRNSIDHGIEKREVRLARNKPKIGMISIGISQVEGTKVQILITDDGGGIDPARVLENTVNHGLLSQEGANALDEQAALQLVFQSGVSTSDIITDISGRGLGMAIVKESVDKLGGDIAIETRKGQGTTFRICLPLTLATFRGILVREYGHIFTLPTSSVERVIRIRKDEVKSVENRETVAVEGVPLSLVRLGVVLELNPVTDGTEDQNWVTVVILKAGQIRMAFVVDRVLSEQEILIKGLGKQLVRVRNIAGATVLGSGQVVLVLNVVDLMKSAARVDKTASKVTLAAKAEVKRKKILIVEDSITARTLFKNILISAGFDVQAVVDGMEAWTSLKEKPFDLVVSDVEMPRMNGFDLTAKIRSEPKLAELPVILVTSLASRQDRERGVEVGADAYIVKSSFEQSNLLEVIRRLV